MGLADELIARGNPASQLRIHGAGRVAKAQLFDIGVSDTRFPFLLFVSQAETEAVLAQALTAGGSRVERGVELLCISSPIATSSARFAIQTGS